MFTRHAIFFLFLLIGILPISCHKTSTVEGNQFSYKDSVFTNYFVRKSGWVSGDGTYSIRLSDGNTLWLMGDSGIDGWKAPDSVRCLFQVRNCALIQSGNDFTTLLDTSSNIKSFFQLAGMDQTKEWFWPLHGYQYQNTVYVFLNHIVYFNSGSLIQFKVKGQFLAKMNYANGKISKITYAALPFINEVTFGAQVLQDITQNKIYMYGNKQNGLAFDLYLARADASNPLNTMEYYDNGVWTQSKTGVANINKSYTVASEFSVSMIQNKYILITQQIGLSCNQGTEIYSFISDSLQGEFTHQKMIWKVDDLFENKTLWTYGGKGHPQFILNNELLISYNVNGIGSCGNVCIGASVLTGHMPAYVYRPKFVRVPLKLIFQ